MMKAFRGIILVAAFWAGSVCAETRIWTGEDGVLFKGEFTRELLGRIQVRDTKGKLHLTPIDKLSKADLLYLQTSISPEVKIGVRKTSRLRELMEWTIAGDLTSLYTLEIAIEKTSKMDSKAKVTTELYVIGTMVDSEDCVLVERATSKFVFPEEKDSKYEFIVKDVPFRKYEANWANDGVPNFNRGMVYLGYIATVLDPKGNVVTYETDLGNESWMDDGVPATVEKLRELYLQGRGSPFSRLFNEKIQKVRVPQVPWYKRTKNPGG